MKHVFAPNELHKNYRLPHTKLHQVFLPTELGQSLKKKKKRKKKKRKLLTFRAFWMLGLWLRDCASVWYRWSWSSREARNADFSPISWTEASEQRFSKEARVQWTVLHKRQEYLIKDNQLEIIYPFQQSVCMSIPTSFSKIHFQEGTTYALISIQCHSNCVKWKYVYLILLSEKSCQEVSFPLLNR